MSDVDRLLSSFAAGTISRHTFVRRLLSLGIGAGFAETLLGTSLRQALAAPNPAQLPARTPRVVLVVMDAFRFDYQFIAPMPNLEWLMARGATFPNAWVGQLESMTPASHATLSTGATPAHHGIIGFSWRNAHSGQEVYGGWYKDVLAGRLEQQMLRHHVSSIPEAVKAADPTARVVSLSGEKYYAADAMGGPAADYILYGLPVKTTIVAKGIPHHVPPERFLAAKGLRRSWPLTYRQFDEYSMTMALESLRTFDPRVLMINLPGCDTYGHRVGGPATPNVMEKLVKGCDAQLGRLIKAFRDRGQLDQTIFVVTADHGMIPNTYQVLDTAVKQTIRAAGGDYLFHTGGSAAFIWLRNPEAAPTVAQHLLASIPHAPFAHYQTVEAGSYAYHPVLPPGQQVDAALEAAQQYLLGTFAGPLSPDIVLSLVENMVVRNVEDGNPTGVHGNHSGATWGVQHVPLVIAGPGVRRGVEVEFPARLMDVAPTILTLLGIAPANMDGLPLAGALLRPTTAQQHAYDALLPHLTAWQRALIQRSQADVLAQSSPPRH